MHWIVVLTLTLAAPCQAHVRRARCNMAPNPMMDGRLDRVMGTVLFSEENNQLTMSLDLKGFDTDNDYTKHGFHIHWRNTIEESCQDAGAHYDPTNSTHGGLNSISRHIGDLGNIEEDTDGKCGLSFTTSQVSLNGPYSILNRTLDIHEKEDDLGLGGDVASLLSGNAGYRIACCVVREDAGGDDTSGAAGWRTVQPGAMLLVLVALMWH